MCKFTNRLFVFALVSLYATAIAAKPLRRSTFRGRNDLLLGGGGSGISTGALLELLQPEYDYDYDLHYDQRQKGAENVRVKLNGVVIGLPSQDSKKTPESSTTSYDDLMELVAQELLGEWLHTDGKLNAKFNKKLESEVVTALAENNGGALSSTTTTAAAITMIDDKTTENIVEIPGNKKELDLSSQGRDQQQLLVIADDSPNWPRTKVHLKGLLNLLKRQRKE